jgi:hypothetical protein
MDRGEVVVVAGTVGFLAGLVGGMVGAFATILALAAYHGAI